TQQPNAFFFGSVQLLVSVPSRNVNNLFLSQVELTGLPLGTFQTLRFTITDGLRNALRGATFNDLTFTVALNAPSGATGTYIFDNLRVVAAANAEFALTANPAAVTVAQAASASSTITVSRLNGFASAVAFTASGLPAGVTAAFHPARHDPRSGRRPHPHHHHRAGRGRGPRRRARRQSAGRHRRPGGDGDEHDHHLAAQRLRGRGVVHDHGAPRGRDRRVQPRHDG